MTIIIFLIRTTISIYLLRGVYSETGVFTTVALALVFIGTELQALAARNMQRQIRSSWTHLP